MTIEPSGSTFTGPRGGDDAAVRIAADRPGSRQVTPGSGWPMIAAMTVHVPPVPVPVGHRTSRSATNGLNQSRPSGASLSAGPASRRPAADRRVPPVADRKTYTNDAPTVIASTTAYVAIVAASVRLRSAREEQADAAEAQDLHEQHDVAAQQVLRSHAAEDEDEGGQRDRGDDSRNAQASALNSLPRTSTATRSASSRAGRASASRAPG